MSNGAFLYFKPLEKTNQALLDGLKACIFILETQGDISRSRRLSLIASIKDLIDQGEETIQGIRDIF